MGWTDLLPFFRGPISNVAPRSNGGSALVQELAKLKGLLAEGALTDSELQIAKRRVLREEGDAAISPPEAEIAALDQQQQALRDTISSAARRVGTSRAAYLAVILSVVLVAVPYANLTKSAPQWLETVPFVEIIVFVGGIALGSALFFLGRGPLIRRSFASRSRSVKCSKCHAPFSLRMIDREDMVVSTAARYEKRFVGTASWIDETHNVVETIACQKCGDAEKNRSSYTTRVAFRHSCWSEFT
jgi:hypothetical protein